MGIYTQPLSGYVHKQIFQAHKLVSFFGVIVPTDEKSLQAFLLCFVVPKNLDPNPAFKPQKNNWYFE